MKTTGIVTKDVVEPFQEALSRIAREDLDILRRVWWPTILLGMEDHLPEGMWFDRWVDDGPDEDGMRVAQIVIVPKYFRE